MGVDCPHAFFFVSSYLVGYVAPVHVCATFILLDYYTMLPPPVVTATLL